MHHVWRFSKGPSSRKPFIRIFKESGSSGSKMSAGAPRSNNLGCEIPGIPGSDVRNAKTPRFAGSVGQPNQAINFRVYDTIWTHVVRQF